MRKISRRDFLKISAGVAAASFLPKSLLGDEEKMGVGPLISVAHGDKAKLVRAAIDALGGIDKFVKPGECVYIKPNLAFAADFDSGAMTSPDIAKQLVQLCLDAGAARVVIIEHTIHDAVLCVKASRIAEALIDKKRTALITLIKEEQFAEIEIPKAKELKSTKIAKLLDEADKLINLPVAKSHSQTGVSLGLKSCMGLIWDRGYLHRINLNQAIADLATAIRSDLTIIDATKVLTTGGPAGPGKTVQLNTVIAGTDVVAIDSYAVGIAKWYNKSFAGNQVKHIVAASELGLGEIETAKMTIKEIEV